MRSTTCSPSSLACSASLGAVRACAPATPHHAGVARSGRAWSASAGRSSTAPGSRSSRRTSSASSRTSSAPQRNLILAQARRRSAGADRRHRRHERQPGLHRRPAHRRRVVLARQLLEGADRRHHADRRDDRRDARSATPRPPGARVQVEFPLTREALVAAFRKALNWNRPFADRPDDAQLVGVSAIAGHRRPRARHACCGRSRRRS